MEIIYFCCSQPGQLKLSFRQRPFTGILWRTCRCAAVRCARPARFSHEEAAGLWSEMSSTAYDLGNELPAITFDLALLEEAAGAAMHHSDPRL